MLFDVAGVAPGPGDALAATDSYCNSGPHRSLKRAVNVETEKAIKPLVKLRRLLKDFPARPTPEDVHDLRTRARRVEATVHALASQHDPAARRLLKRIKPLRKAAGKVRDMDVLLAKLPGLCGMSAGDGLVGLGEHLRELRRRHADDLLRAIGRRRGAACRELKRFTRSVQRSWSDGSAATFDPPQILAAQLEHWPRLDAGNLHEFRILAKELRYMLQLTSGVDPRRMDALDQTKDAAGEWHDWLELNAAAQEVLDPEADREILRRIDSLTREKLRAALQAANRLRRMSMDLPRAA